MMAQNKFDISKLQANIKAALARLPNMAGQTVVNFALDNFQRQGFLGDSLDKWPARKKETARNKGKAILIQTGRLRRSIRIVKTSGTTVVVGSDVPYAKAHNEGFKGNVKFSAHWRSTTSFQGMKGVKTLVKPHGMNMNMPRRQFLGNSPYLTKQLQRLIVAEIMRAAKNSQQ